MNPYIKQANQQFVPVYNRYPIVWDHGEGMYLYELHTYTARTDGEAATHL